MTPAPADPRSTVIRGVSVTLAANLITVGCMAVLVLGLPLFVDQETYGYWSLYQFYALYLGYLTFGITDGIHLRYGGRRFEDLPRPLFVSQFWVMALLCVLGNAIVLVALLAGADGPDRRAVVIAVCVGNAMFVMRTFVTMTMQATRRLGDYAVLTAAERLAVVAATALALAVGAGDVETLVWIDAVAKAVILLLAVLRARPITLGNPAPLTATLRETRENMSVGTKVVIANLAIVAVYGVLRLFVELSEPIEVFGQVSLAIALASTFMVLVNSLAIVLFPTLRTLTPQRYARVFTVVRDGLTLVMTVALITYFPVVWVLERLLPDYDIALRYLVLLYPIAMFDGKMRLLAATFLKALRRETLLMTINLAAAAVGVVVFAAGLFWIGSLDLTMLLLVLLLVARSVLAEYAVGRALQVPVARASAVEVAVATVFVILAWWLSTGWAALAFTVLLAAYLVIRRDAVRALWRVYRGTASV